MPSFGLNFDQNRLSVALEMQRLASIENTDHKYIVHVDNEDFASIELTSFLFKVIQISCKGVQGMLPRAARLVTREGTGISLFSSISICPKQHTSF